MAGQTEAGDLVARGHQLRAEVASHKAAIRQHRAALGAAAAELLEYEAECRRRGIAVIHVRPGEGVIHGRPSRS